MRNIEDTVNISFFLADRFRKWCDENGREPKYFVVHPKDYTIIYRQLVSASVIYPPSDKLMGLPILVNDSVPVGEFEFVG